MIEVKKFDVVSVAKIMAIIYAIVGLLEGLIFALLFVVSPFKGSGMFAGFGILVVIVFPILGAILGFIGGAIMAFLYNVIAGAVGGIKFDSGN